MYSLIGESFGFAASTTKARQPRQSATGSSRVTPGQGPRSSGTRIARPEWGVVRASDVPRTSVSPAGKASTNTGSPNELVNERLRGTFGSSSTGKIALRAR